MARKSSPIEKAARMLDLVPFITAHQGIGTAELASEFGISEEELLNDLNSLWMCGDSRFDLTDLQFDSGYVTIRNAETLNLIRSLTQQEIISILLGLDLIEKELPPDRSDLRNEIDSLRNSLGRGISRILDASPVHSGEIISIIKEGLSAHKKIRIIYFSPAGDEISDRVITPLALNSTDSREFLIAFCDQAQAQRTFRVDRIKSAQLLDLMSAPIPAETHSGQLAFSAEIHIGRQMRKSRESLGDYVNGTGAEVTVSGFNPQWLSRTVISAAGAMEVRASLELREQIAEEAAKTLNQYR
jgi:predicted DNA-binding transcriptional regulator YafY